MRFALWRESTTDRGMPTDETLPGCKFQNKSKQKQNSGRLIDRPWNRPERSQSQTLSWLRTMNKTVRAWEVAVSLGRARRTISFYFPCSRLPFRLIIENPEELWFSWTGSRLSLTPDGETRDLRIGAENTSGIRIHVYRNRRRCRCLENAVRGKSGQRWEVK